MTLKCDSANIETWCIRFFIYCLTQLLAWQVSPLQCNWAAPKLATWIWLAVWLRQCGALHEDLLRFFAILLKPNATPAVQTYLLNLWIWPEYTHKKKTLNWGTCSESMPEPSQSIVKSLLGDKKTHQSWGPHFVWSATNSDKVVIPKSLLCTLPATVLKAQL